MERLKESEGDVEERQREKEGESEIEGETVRDGSVRGIVRKRGERV